MSRAEPAPAAASHDDNKESVDSMRQAIREGREYEADLINKKDVGTGCFAVATCTQL